MIFQALISGGMNLTLVRPGSEEPFCYGDLNQAISSEPGGSGAQASWPGACGHGPLWWIGIAD